MSGQLALAIGLTLLTLAVALVASLMIRRLIISRGGGVVECSLRQAADGVWQHGMAEYRRDQLCWHKSLSLRRRPQAAFDRGRLVVLGGRVPTPAEQATLGPGQVVVRCRTLVRLRGGPARSQVIELAMSEAARTGLLAWLEAAPAYGPHRPG